MNVSFSVVFIVAPECDQIKQQRLKEALHLFWNTTKISAICYSITCRMPYTIIIIIIHLFVVLLLWCHGSGPPACSYMLSSPDVSSGKMLNPQLLPVVWLLGLEVLNHSSRAGETPSIAFPPLLNPRVQQNPTGLSGAAINAMPVV